MGEGCLYLAEEEEEEGDEKKVKKKHTKLIYCLYGFCLFSLVYCFEFLSCLPTFFQPCLILFFLWKKKRNIL